MSHLPRPRGEHVEGYIEWALEVTNIIVAEYLTRSKMPLVLPRSGQDLFDIINEHHVRCRNSEILVCYLEEMEGLRDASLFLGLVMRVGKNARPEVYLNPFQDLRGKRLGLIQEAFQCLLEHEPLRTPELRAALENYRSFRDERDFEKANGSTHGEIIAEIAAMEALFPYKMRVEWVERCGHSPLSDDLEIIALTFGVPAKWIRFYLQKEIMAQLEPFYR